MRLDEYQRAARQWQRELDRARGVRMRHPWLLRAADGLIQLLGDLGLRRPRWLNRLQMRAALSDYQHGHGGDYPGSPS